MKLKNTWLWVAQIAVGGLLLFSGGTSSLARR